MVYGEIKAVMVLTVLSTENNV